MQRRLRFLLLVTMWCVASSESPASFAGDSPVLWPAEEREFLEDGPGFLLPPEERQALAAATPKARREMIAAFLESDPIPETRINELALGIVERHRLALGYASTFLDDRARIAFLHGAPTERQTVECGATFVPIEVWRYPLEVSEHPLLFFRRVPGQPYRLWNPIDSKRVLYTPEMEYWLQQYEELRSRIRSKRFDLLTCSETRLIDRVTGIEGLTGYQKERPASDEIRRLLEAPRDLATWARMASALVGDEAGKELAVESARLLFPERIQQRLVARVLIVIPADAELGVADEEEKTRHRLAVEGLIEEGGEVFEEFRVRFKIPPAAPGLPLALAVERRLRPGREYLLRLHIVDEVNGGEARLTRGFRVPENPQVLDEPGVPEGVVVELGEQLAEKRLAGKDSLLLVPPERDIVLGVWRAEALVTGDRISKVVFLVDGNVQLTRTKPPFSAEVRLAQFPTEQIIRAEGYDELGELVAADDVVVNQPRGAFKVRILRPARGLPVAGSVEVLAEVVVPDERRVTAVEFFLNEALQTTRDRIPWRATLQLPAGEEISYLTVVATLDDGSRAEQVRFLNSPTYLEEVDVNLVEVLTTVLDRSNRPVADLQREDFEVLEDGRPQRIEKFELVKDLPLTVGFAIDTSGSMEMALPEAQRAAIGFLENLITRRDKVFALGFAGEPVLLIPPTDDIKAVEGALEELRSVGWTALHDAVVSSLYYFRGTRGRKALILLSDGDDSASYYAFRDALEYARRSGVVIYTVGIGVSGIKAGIRRKLNQLADETGGQAFFIARSEELAAVYQSIEDELRSQYLLTYSSDAGESEETFRTIEIRVRNGKLKTRATRGYYPS